MRSKIQFLTNIAAVALAVMLILPGLGCDGKGTIEPETQSTHRVEGWAVSNYSNDTTLVGVKFARNDEPLPNARVVFDNSNLGFMERLFGVDSLYWRIIDSARAFPPDSISLELIDSNLFHDIVYMQIADSFEITAMAPDKESLTVAELSDVQLTWNGSTNADTYVMAAVLSDSAYNGYGYSFYPATGGNYGTFPIEAFYLSGGVDPDTGLYNLYVYAIAGFPDSVLTNTVLPVPLPDSLADNISVTLFTGRVGSVVVCEKRSVRVVMQ